MFKKKPNLNIIDETCFSELNKECQDLVIKAEKGNCKSIVTVAKGFIYGKNNFPRNTDLGLNYLRFGAEKDNAESLKLYGRYLLQGEIIDKNEIEAIKILNNAATKTKNASVKLELAEIMLSNQSFDTYDNSSNNNINYPLVKQLYKDAADYGNLEGMTKYGQYCLKSKINQNGEIQPDYSEAYTYFKKAAYRGNTEAMIRYGKLLEKGVPNIPIDLQSAKSWYKKSYEGGNLGGFAEYGYALISSKYGDTDEPEGYRLIKYSSDHNNPLGMLAYGAIIEAGMLCVQQDDQRSYELIKKAADQGEPNAINALGMFYEKGVHVDKNSHVAEKIYNLALHEGSFNAIENLGRIYMNGNDGIVPNMQASRRYYKIGADAGLPESIYQYCNNLYKDDEMLLHIYEIRKYLEKGRTLKDPKCILFLGKLYLKGDLFPKKIDLGEMFVKEAAEMGSIEAMMRFIDIYNNEKSNVYEKPPEIKKYEAIINEPNGSKTCLLI